MKRSEIDDLLRSGWELLAEMGIALPPQAEWDLRTWYARREEARELARRGIGWDLTDFGWGEFHRFGLLLYTLSNGRLDAAEGEAADQSYAQKYLLVEAGQRTPMHHHWKKMEDIAVLGGGRLELRLFNAGPDDALDTETPVRLLRNGLWVSYDPGKTINLNPGERVRLEQHHYHAFQGEAGGGPVVLEEVSMVNDDARDNCFLPGDDVGRFPEIEEDARPRFLLCTELPGSEAFARLVETHLG